MAFTVPRLDGPAVQTAPVAIPQAQAFGADAFGAGIAKGLGDSGRVVSTFAKQEQDKADAGMVLKSLSEADSVDVAMVNGARELKGEQALGMSTVFMENYDKANQAIREKMGTEEQRTAFDKLMEPRRHSFEKLVNTHEYEQSNAWNIGNAEAAVKSSFTRMGLYGNDPVRFEDARLEMERNATAALQLKGFGPNSDATKEKLFELNNKAYEDRIQARIATNATEAKGLFDALRTKLDPDTAARLEKQLKPAVSFQVGLDTANALLDQNPTATADDLLNKLRKDPVVSKDKEAFTFAEGQIRTMKVAQESARKQHVEQVEAAVVAPLAKMIADSSKPGGRLPTLNDLRNDPNAAELLKQDPEKYQKISEHIITANDRAAERLRAEADRKERKQEHATRQAILEEERATKKTQRSNYADLWSDPGALQKTNLDYLVLQEKLTPEQAKSLEARKTEAGKDTLLSEVAEVKAVLGAAKIKEKTPAYDQAIEYINQRKSAFEADEKRKPRASEVKDMAREAVHKTATGWFDLSLDKPAYRTTISDIPAAEVKKIKAALTAKGRATSDGNIVSLYSQKQMRAK